MNKPTQLVLAIVFLSTSAFAQSNDSVSFSKSREFSDYMQTIHSYSGKRLHLESIKLRTGIGLSCTLAKVPGTLLTGIAGVGESLPLVDFIFLSASPESQDIVTHSGGSGLLRVIAGGALSGVTSAAIDRARALTGDQAVSLKNTAWINYSVTRALFHKFFKQESPCSRALWRIGAVLSEIQSRNRTEVNTKVSAMNKIKRSLGFAVTSGVGSAAGASGSSAK